MMEQPQLDPDMHNQEGKFRTVRQIACEEWELELVGTEDRCRQWWSEVLGIGILNHAHPKIPVRQSSNRGSFLPWKS